jgi:hypothetical protein
MPKVQKLKIEHKPLHCPLCEKRFMNILGQPLPNHCQIRCTTTDGNEMDLGICSDCVETGISLNTCQAVLEGIKDFWIYEIDTNQKMTENEKTRRKNFHNSHKLENVAKIVDTGKRAEKEARKQGKLK